MRIVDTSAIEPRWWVLSFGRKADQWWIEWLVPGKYKHVRAAAPLPELGGWIFYDVHLGGTSIIVAANGPEAEIVWSQFRRDSDLLRFHVKPGAKCSPFYSIFSRFGFGFFCAPAIKHLLGLRSGALRPTALYRDCLAAGAEHIE